MPRNSIANLAAALVAAALLVGHSGTSAFAQTGSGWRRASGDGPPARIIGATAYDPERGVVVLFGGDRIGGTPLGDTWEWDGSEWRKVDSAGPAPRYGHAMVYDHAAGGVLLFGGYDKADSLFGDTWLRKDGRWMRLETAGPDPRRSPGIAFDPARRRVVLYGGFGGLPSEGDAGQHRFYGDTWEWDGRKWTQVATAGPAPRYGGILRYDPVLAKVLLFGGNDHAGNIYGDTWSWDGRRWDRLSSSGPSPRGGGLLATTRDGLLMLGGFAGRQVFTDAWKWDGQGWVPAPATDAPIPQLVFPVLETDAGRRVAVLIGPTGPAASTVETWELALPR